MTEEPTGEMDQELSPEPPIGGQPLAPTTEAEQTQEELTTREPQEVVEIKTPLERPEFDWFLTEYMRRMGIPDRKQAAIMLSRMLYDMGLDPYADLKDVQAALTEMNSMLNALPDTPGTRRVRDTIGQVAAAKAGRTLLERIPSLRGGSDPMMDRFERMMDKYFPMIQGMKMMKEMMSDEDPRRRSTEEVPNKVQQELTNLRSEVTTLRDTLKEQAERRQEKQRAKNLVAEVTNSIAPQLQGLAQRIEAIATQTAALQVTPQPQPMQPPRNTEMEDAAKLLKEVADNLAEKIGKQTTTLGDVDIILDLVEKLESRFKKPTDGELDWKTAGLSSLSEIGKEAIIAYKEVATASKTSGTPSTQAPQQPNTEMQRIIKKQVQNYIIQRLTQGATTMNIQDAAQTLGLSTEQVAWAYQTLMNEGWINVKTPKPPQEEQTSEQEQKPKGEPENGKPTTPAPPNTPEQPGQQPFIET